MGIEKEMIHFQNILVSFKLILYFQYIKPTSILLSGTMEISHIHHTIIYTTNSTALKNKHKLIDAIHFNSILGIILEKKVIIF